MFLAIDFCCVTGLSIQNIFMFSVVDWTLCISLCKQISVKNREYEYLLFLDNSSVEIFENVNQMCIKIVMQLLTFMGQRHFSRDTGKDIGKFYFLISGFCNLRD